MTLAMSVVHNGQRTLFEDPQHKIDASILASDRLTQMTE